VYFAALVHFIVHPHYSSQVTGDVAECIETLHSKLHALIDTNVVIMFSSLMSEPRSID
jgi:hypothetical protein